MYLGVYSGWYNVREETFVTETDAAANDYKDPDTGKPLKKMEEKSYFFRMSKFQERLIAHIQAHPEFIQPEMRRNEVLERLKVPLIDLSVSRTTFTWGARRPPEPRLEPRARATHGGVAHCACAHQAYPSPPTPSTSCTSGSTR